MVNKTNKNRFIIKRKTRVLRKKYNKYTREEIIKMFLEMLNTIKLYHWHTYSYPQHKATDELYDELNESIDNFVEIMLGKNGGRFNLSNSKVLPLKNYTNINNLKQEIENYKSFLINMNHNLNVNANTDLMNTRDEILGHLNKFTYLITLH
jgi:DNA-binding ferritin-like protein